MVRKRLICVLFALAVILAVPIHASAADVYTEGNLSPTYIAYFEDILGKVSPLDDYVFFRSGANDYTMVVGDLYYSGTTIIGVGECTVYTISEIVESDITSYQFNSALSNGYTLNIHNSLVYSNLGDFPDLIERGDYVETALLLLVLVIVFMSLVSRIFSFNLRYKR